MRLINQISPTVDEALHRGHPVGGQCPCFVRANAGGVAHRLAGVQVPDQVVVLHHLLHGVGQRQGDGQRQALGHGHHEDGDPNDEELDEVVEVRQREGLLADQVVGDAEADEQNEHGANGHEGA
jgi:hypothetical protein